jgi:hypothetical protein
MPEKKTKIEQKTPDKVFSEFIALFVYGRM